MSDFMTAALEGQMDIPKRSSHPAAHFPLSLVSEGETVCVSKVRGTQEVRQHLATLGFVKDASVRVITKTASGDVIVTVKGARIALDRSSASHVLTS